MDKNLLPRDSSGSSSYSGYYIQVLYSLFYFLKKITDPDFKCVINESFDDFLLIYEDNCIEIYQSKSRRSGSRRLSISEITQKEKKTSLSILDELVDNYHRFKDHGYCIKKLIILTNSDCNKDLADISIYNTGNFKDEVEKKRIYAKIDNDFQTIKAKCDLTFNKEIFSKLRFLDRQGNIEQIISMIKNEIREIIKRYTLKNVIKTDLPDRVFNDLYALFSGTTANHLIEGSTIKKEVLFELLVNITTERYSESENEVKFDILTFKMASSGFNEEEIMKAKLFIIRKFKVSAYLSSMINYKRDMAELNEIITSELLLIQKNYIGNLIPNELDELYKQKIDLIINNLSPDLSLSYNQAKVYSMGSYYENSKECIIDWIKRD